MDTENICWVIFLCLTLIVATILNAGVCFILFRHDQFSTPHYWILTTCCVTNIFLSIGNNPFVLVLILQDNYDARFTINKEFTTMFHEVTTTAVNKNVTGDDITAFINNQTIDIIDDITRNGDVISELICGIHKRISLICFYFAMAEVALLSFERYIFFCHPFAYPRYFSPKRLVATILLMGLFPIVVISATMSHLNFVWEPKFLSCYANNHHRETAILYAVIFMLPTLSVVIFCVVKMARLISLKKKQIQNQVVPQGNFMSVHAKVSGWSLRMVLIVSGTFWICYLIPWGTFGITLMIGHHQWLVNQYLIKYNIMVFFCLSPCINPFIYLHTHKELRKIVWHYFKRTRIENWNMQITIET